MNSIASAQLSSTVTGNSAPSAPCLGHVFLFNRYQCQAHHTNTLAVAPSLLSSLLSLVLTTVLLRDALLVFETRSLPSHVLDASKSG